MGMKIGFDAKRIFHNNTGLGNYGRTLIKNLHTYYPEVKIVLFTPSIKETKETAWILSQDAIEIVAPPKSVNKNKWRSIGIKQDINALKIDLFHGLSNELPLLGLSNNCKWIVTIHDLIFKYYKKQYAWSDRMIYHMKSKSAIRKADGIFAISKSTKHDILKYYQVDDSKVKITYQSCGTNFSMNDQVEKKYFLFVSGLNERKGLKELLAAILLLAPEDRRPLKVVGTGGRYEIEQRNFVAKNHLSQWVTFLGQVSNDDLTLLYKESIALVYPSYAEGFGIPIIEALSSGTHVITSSVSAMPEAAGTLGHYVEPGNIKALASALVETKYYSSLDPDRVLDHLATFNTKNTTKVLYDNYQTICS